MDKSKIIKKYFCKAGLELEDQSICNNSLGLAVYCNCAWVLLYIRIKDMVPVPHDERGI
jgi:hypothetical protein